jgi:glycosyltransferase involved in cell wall biosynthesis
MINHRGRYALGIHASLSNQDHYQTNHMKVAHIVASIEPKYGGPSISVPHLCKALAQAGHTIDLLTTCPGNAYSETNDSLSIHVFRRSWPGAICPSTGLRRHLLSHKYDIIHCHGIWLRPLHYAKLNAQINNAPLVISPRGMLNTWAWNHHTIRKRIASSFIHPEALNACNAWHATSDEEALDIKKLGYNQLSCVSPNGVSLPDKKQEDRAKEHWLKEFPQLAGKPIALFYSRFHRKKRVLELIDLWITQAPKNWVLLLVGIPQEYSVQQIEDYIMRNSGVGRIIVADGSDLPPPFAIASLFLLPSHSENFGLVVPEALVNGLPVLVTDTTPWAAINDTDFGWCGPWDNFKDAMLASMALGPGVLRQKGEAGRQWALDRYSWNRSAKELETLYLSLLQKAS